jgi:hypothetical protein
MLPPPTPSPTLMLTLTRIPPPPPSSLQRVLHPVPPAGQATPCWLKFSDTPAPPTPRVPCVSTSAIVCPPPTSPAILPVCEPISHCTRSCAQGPLALFTSRQPYHEQVKYHISTAKATPPADEPLAFVGLCEAFDMKPAKVEGFAFLCEALMLEDGSSLLALSVLDPTTGEFCKHCQLRRDPHYKATWDTLYVNKLGCLCQGIGTGTTPTSQRVSGTNTFFLIDFQDFQCARGRKSATPW